MSMRVLIFYFLLLRAAVSEEHRDAIDATGNTNFDEDNELLQVNADHASVAATIDVMEDSIKCRRRSTCSRRRDVYATMTIKSSAEHKGCAVRSEPSLSSGKFLCNVWNGAQFKVNLQYTEKVTTKSHGDKLRQQLGMPTVIPSKRPCWGGGWVTQNCFDGCQGLKEGTTCYQKFLQKQKDDETRPGQSPMARAMGVGRTTAEQAIDKAMDKYGAKGARLKTEDKAAHGQIEAAKQLEASALGKVLHELDQITRLPEEGRKDEFAAMLKKWCPAETLRGRGVCWMIQGAAIGDHKGSAIEQVQRDILEIGQLTDAEQKRKRFGALLKEWHCSGKLEDDVCAEITKAAADGR